MQVMERLRGDRPAPDALPSEEPVGGALPGSTGAQGAERGGIPPVAPTGNEPGAVEAKRDRFDVKRTWQAGVGAVLIPLGVVIILFGWYGAAHTPYVQQQIPFMASGSFIGLGLMVTGGLLFWAQWLYRIYDQADLHQEQLAVTQQALVKVLGDLSEAVSRLGSLPAGMPGIAQPSEVPSLVPSPAPAPAPAPAPSLVPSLVPAPQALGVPASGAKGRLYATAVGSAYHLGDCPVVASFTGGVHEVDEAARARMQPCRICHPDA
ncbi:MAG: hypothetical protein M0035_18960 [Actinomycetota bacterium]|nr:hypothetical protein [Actinomycetota bacterium]